MSIQHAIVLEDDQRYQSADAKCALARLEGFGVEVHESTGQADELRALLEELQLSLDSTWLISPSEEVLEWAEEFGMHTCLVLGRGVALPTSAGSRADVVAHGWPEVTPELLDDYARVTGNTRQDAVCQVLIVCGSPEPSSPKLLQELARQAHYVIACDAGAMRCFEAGIQPQAFVGDGDSCDSETLAWLESLPIRRIVFPPEKYATDLSLAIDAARHEAAREDEQLELVLTSATGGRPDHALGVLGLLYEAADTAPRVVEDGFEMRILSPRGATSWQLGSQAQNKTFSLVALEDNTVVSECGMKWELNRRSLSLLTDTAISNIVVSRDAEVCCHAGVCAAYLFSRFAK